MRWKLLYFFMRYINRNTYINTDVVAKIQADTGFSFIMSELLCQRNITSFQLYQSFARPSVPTDDDPYVLSDMAIAVHTIQEAIHSGKKICIYGDYDVDGVCATAILYKTLKRYTSAITWYIPSRHSEGYGMHLDSIQKIANEGTQLIITVDNGISAIAEAELAAKLGMDLVITDHHRFPGILPIAKAIVASSRNNYASDINDLSGAGIAWMLARALTHESLLDYLPLVALAIAADSVNVTKYNRAYLINAFPLFVKDPHFRVLLKNAGAGEKPVSMYTLNYIFAPRINAAGRIAHADIALRFFLSDDEAEIERFAAVLEELNTKRKNEERRILNECLSSSSSTNNVLVFFGEDWNTGVVGIVASKITELQHKNVFVLGKTGTGEYIGSGRSDSMTDLYALLLPCSDILERFGGHAGAAGITVSEKNIPAFIEQINRSYKQINPDGAPPMRSEYDIDIITDECTAGLVKEIETLAPFGPGNPEPVFRFSNSIIRNISCMGKEREHLSANINNSSSHTKDADVRLVAFNHGSEYEIFRSSELTDILATLTINSYKGFEKCEARLLAYNTGLFCSERPEFMELINAFFSEVRYNNKKSLVLAEQICNLLDRPYICENRLRELYVLLRNRYLNRGMHLPYISTGTAEEVASLLIFKELGLVSFNERTICFVDAREKTDCHNSLIFRYLNK